MDVLRVSAPDGSVHVSVVPEIGAAVSSLIMPGPAGPQELLYREPSFWDKGSEKTRGGFPFLFPICGRLERDREAGAYAYAGRVYRMAIHGFGMRLPWTVVDDGSESELVLELRDTETTRLQYPFEFKVALRFRADCGTLVIEQEYANIGDKAMPYYAGFHPYFCTPEAGKGKEKTKIDFEPACCFAYNERLTDLAGEKDIPVLPASVSEPSVNELLARLGGENRGTKLILPDGLMIHMLAEGVDDADMFPYVQLYTSPEMPFFCVEPWMGFPNALNTVCGVRWVDPGKSERGVLRVWTRRISEAGNQISDIGVYY